jgi:hypothetical protein
MRWSMRAGPRCIHASAPREAAEPRRRRGECADYIVLARRMSIPADDAIRQFVDASIGLTAGDRAPEHR